MTLILLFQFTDESHGTSRSRMGKGGLTQSVTSVVQTFKTNIPRSKQRVRRHTGVFRKVS